MTSSPVILCHYGNSPYLKYTVRALRASNPNSRIVLLGDKSNRWLKQYIEHHYFSAFDQGDLIDEFNRVYRLVAGKESPMHKEGDEKRDWIDFVFRRWFMVESFCKNQNIDSFWHFDSDNMILSDLASHEVKFKDVDCTEQCSGSCMNGFISNLEVVTGYIRKINEIFKRTEYLDILQKEFDTKHPTYAFTEMRAYRIYKSESAIKTRRLSSIIDNSSFDDCICSAGGMQTEVLPSGAIIKKVLLQGTGFFWETPKGDRIRANSINLSWVPMYFFEGTYRHLIKTLKHQKSADSDSHSHLTLSEAFPFMQIKYRLMNHMKSLNTRITNRLKKCLNAHQSY